MIAAQRSERGHSRRACRLYALVQYGWQRARRELHRQARSQSTRRPARRAARLRAHSAPPALPARRSCRRSSRLRRLRLLLLLRAQLDRDAFVEAVTARLSRYILIVAEREM